MSDDPLLPPYERTYQALEHLVLSSIALQRERADLKGRLSESAWLNELCTVRCGGPRQSGHSMAIARLAVGLRDRGISDVACITKTNVTAMDVARTAEDLGIEDRVPGRAQGRWRSIKWFRWKNGDLEKAELVDVVFLDSACLWSRSDLRWIREYALRCSRKREVFVLAYVQ